MKTHTIDATGKRLGRVATEAATVLRGKDQPNYAPNVAPQVTVEIINASKIDLSDKKLAEQYTRYTGYPGGLREETRGHLIDRKGFEPVFKHAVRGMLPNNKLRAEMLKRLVVTG